MKVGPSEPPCRRRLQTAISCFGPKTAVVNVMVKRRDIRSRHVGIREMSANDPPRKHRKPHKRHPKPGPSPCPGISMKDTYLLVMRGPVYRRHDSYPGFRTELENRVGDAKGKSPSGDPTRPKVPMHRSGAHCFVRAMKRGNARGAKGAGHPRRGGVNGKPEELLVLMEGGSLLWVARAG
jgi:hypothetical protein